MRALLIAALLLSPAVAPASRVSRARPETLGPGDHALTIAVGGLGRHYAVHVPPAYDGRKPVPVVIMLHGGGGSAKGAIYQTGWGAKADEAGFLAVFPEATPPDPTRPARFRGNPQTWNDGSGRWHSGRRSMDDVGFLRSVMDDFEARFAVDARRIYVTGFSNGASMAFRVGAELSTRVAAIAPVSGHFWLKEAKLERPVPLIFMIGSEDPLNPPEGGQAKTAGRRSTKKPPVRDSLLKWAEMLGCDFEPKIVYDQDGVKTVAYRPCKDGSEVLFYTIEGMGHTWPGGKSRLPVWMVGKTSDKLKATDVIWEFFQKHPKRQP